MIKQGTGNIINGHFKIIHLINLDDYDFLIKQMETTIKHDISKTSTLRPQLDYQLSKIKNMILQLKPNPIKIHKRSINWIGSAWKWLAGNPDATDWDNILKSNNDLTDNNNKQYHINRDLYNVTNKLIKEYNSIIHQMKTQNTDEFEQYIFNKLSIVKDEVYQIVMAYQLAKSGIVQSSLLNQAEIASIISTSNTLPFNNEIEAIENASPTMLIKESLLLYVISLPQIELINYDKVLVKSTVSNDKKILLNHTHLLMSDVKKFGITKECKKIKDRVLCYMKNLEELSSNDCLSRILDKKSADCNYQYHDDPVVELVSEGTLFVSNFHDKIGYHNSFETLNGSYIINFYNDTIRVNDVEYSNWVVVTEQAFPPFMKVNLTEREISIDIKYLHKLHLDNIKKLKSFTVNTIASNSLMFIFVVTLVIFVLISNCKKHEAYSIPMIEPIKINYPLSP